MTTRILLADDHEIVRQGLRLLLQREGFEVIGEAANGQEAIRLAAENCPDVAVLDYGMPLLNGIGAGRGVLQLVAEGKTTKEAAKLLGISAKTVESHPDHEEARHAEHCRHRPLRDSLGSDSGLESREVK